MQVMEDGQLSVLNFSPAPSTLKQDEGEPEEEEDREMARINVKHREHCPRWAYNQSYVLHLKIILHLINFIFIKRLQIISDEK